MKDIQLMWVKLIVNEYIVREQFTRKCLQGIKLPGYPDSLNDVINEVFTHTKGIWERAWKKNLQKKKARIEKKKELKIEVVKGPVKVRGLSDQDTDVQSTGGRVNHDDFGFDLDEDDLNWSQIFEIKGQDNMKKVEPQAAGKAEAAKEAGAAENPEVKAK